MEFLRGLGDRVKLAFGFSSTPSINSLPSDILTRVFFHLDPISQVRSRRVCKSWDKLLREAKQPKKTAVILKLRKLPDYRVYAICQGVVHKLLPAMRCAGVQEITEFLVIGNPEEKGWFGENMLEFLNKLVDWHIPVLTLRLQSIGFGELPRWYANQWRNTTPLTVILDNVSFDVAGHVLLPPNLRETSRTYAPKAIPPIILDNCTGQLVVQPVNQEAFDRRAEVDEDMYIATVRDSLVPLTADEIEVLESVLLSTGWDGLFRKMVIDKAGHQSFLQWQYGSPVSSLSSAMQRVLWATVEALFPALFDSKTEKVLETEAVIIEVV